LGRLGLPVCRILSLAGEASVVMRLLGGELEDGDGCHPLGVLHLFCLLSDALCDDCAAAIKPSYLEIKDMYVSKTSNSSKAFTLL